MRVVLSLTLLLVAAACDRGPSGRDLYACSNGINLTVTRQKRSSELRLSTGEVRKLRRLSAAQGMRYGNEDQLHWFERGDQAVLARKGESANCRLIVRNL